MGSPLGPEAKRPRWTFARAVQCCELNREVEEPSTQRRYESAERFILTTEPRTISEALAVIETLKFNLATGQRGDAADIIALDNLRCYIAGRLRSL
jgi:hypothetical protein